MHSIEGYWEDIAAHAEELAGQRVRLTILADYTSEPFPGIPPELRQSTASSLLKFSGTWIGEDIDERLTEVYANRSKANA